jgi:hypothetical protein
VRNYTNTNLFPEGMGYFQTGSLSGTGKRMPPPQLPPEIETASPE